MVSVIIRVRNEQEYIGFAIQSVLDHLAEYPLEINIINNNSSDNSLNIVNLFKDRVLINIFNVSDDNYSPGFALNGGVAMSSYQTVLILSAHAQIIAMDFDYVQKNLKKYDAVFGNQEPIYYGKKITKRYIWSHFVDSEVENMYSKIEDRPFLHNAFCFYNKRALIEMPFDEQLSGKEDRYWACDLISRGGQYLYSPKIGINHFFTKNGATWHGLG